MINGCFRARRTVNDHGGRLHLAVSLGLNGSERSECIDVAYSNSDLAYGLQSVFLDRQMPSPLQAPTGSDPLFVSSDNGRCLQIVIG
jgi:hypothetical protein